MFNRENVPFLSIFTISKFFFLKKIKNEWWMVLWPFLPNQTKLFGIRKQYLNHKLKNKKMKDSSCKKNNPVFFLETYFVHLSTLILNMFQFYQLYTSPSKMATKKCWFCCNSASMLPFGCLASEPISNACWPHLEPRRLRFGFL